MQAPGSTATTEATITGAAETTRVIFSVDGESLGELSTPPFQFSLAADALEAGGHNLTVEAELADGQRLVRNVRFETEPPPPEPTEVPPPLPPAVTEAPSNLVDFFTDNPIWLVSGGLLVLGLVGLALLAAQRRPLTKMAGGAGGYTGPEDLTRNIRLDEVVAMLTVRESPRLLPGQPFDISENVLRLGSSAESDILVPDESISPQHAEIRLQDGSFHIFDLGSEHGTRVNGEDVGPEGTPLPPGALISLGNETKLSFSTFGASPLDTNPIGSLADFSKDIFVDETQTGSAPEESPADSGSQIDAQPAATTDDGQATGE